AQGIFNSGASLGAVISAPAIALLYLQFGWKATFIIIGLFGFLWLVPWLLIFKAPPERHPWLSAEEREYILTGQRDESAPAGEEQAAPGWFEMLRFRQSWSVVASRFFLDPIWWLFVSWLPIYLAATFGFDIAQIGFSAWVPYVGAMAGALFGGWLARYLLEKGRTVDYARKLTITLGGVIMLPALLLTAAAATPVSAILLIAVILFGFQTAIGNIQTLPSDFFSGKSVGSLAGVGGAAAVAGVLITTELIPRIIEASGVRCWCRLRSYRCGYSAAGFDRSPRRTEPGDNRSRSPRFVVHPGTPGSGCTTNIWRTVAATLTRCAATRRRPRQPARARTSLAPTIASSKDMSYTPGTPRDASPV
ncbi:MAG: MFS transporter, partial [Pseudomonadales bacterium]|nr:MFS transporter [Pseudomonadales bacterium]